MIYAYEDNINDIVISSKNKDIEIIIKADTPDNTYIFYIKNGDIDTLSIEANVNSGDKEQVANFFIWSLNTFKADINIVNFWNHGNGWYEYKDKSILYDNNPYDFISIVNNELEYIFNKIKNSIGRKIDIAIFDACNMQSIEVLYEIKDYCKYSIGSALIVPYYGLPYERIISSIDTIDNIESISRYICKVYYEYYKNDYDSLQISFVNLDNLKFDYSYFENINRLNNEDIAIYDNTQGESFENLDFNVLYKMFYPIDVNKLLFYYEDYIKLNIDKKFNIMKYEFQTYNTIDTIPPIPICSLNIIDKNYSNYLFETNKTYDLTDIRNYNFYIMPKHTVYENNFEDTMEVFTGNYQFVDDAFDMQYALKTDSIKLNINTPYEKNLITFKVKGIYRELAEFYIVSDNDTIRIDKFDYNKFTNIVKCINAKEFYIYYKSYSNDYIILDNIIVYSREDEQEFVSNDNNTLIHKLGKGNYLMYITVNDIYDNYSQMDTIFNVEIENILFSYVYPNPAKDFINIKSDFNGTVNISLYTANGQLIDRFDRTISNGIVNIDLRKYNLGSGLYFYTINDNIKQMGKFFVK